MKNSSQNVVCSSDFIANTSGTLDLVSKSMTLIESQWGTNDPRVIEEKKVTLDLEAEHLNITLELNKKCGDNLSQSFSFIQIKRMPKTNLRP